ncbi:MAG: cytochrome c [Alphaproteobacteria bacterium]|nr:cytochrome c [Alphaproteobacteria bacterium]
MRRAGLAGLLAAQLCLAAQPLPAQGADAELGMYLVRAAGCVTCHTAEKGGTPLAGGRKLDTPFGAFYTPNITPDVDTGIGGWTEQEFVSAVRKGQRPDGAVYYPAFPYPSYAGITEDDARAMWTYLRSLDPVSQANRDHALDFPFNWRFLNRVWQWLFFEEAGFKPDPAQSEAWNRGAYLVRHLGHCGECHSPRGALGAVKEDRALSGNPAGPEGKRVPNITPHEKGIQGWSASDLAFFLQLGILPDGDVAGGAMEDVIADSTGHLSATDREAIAEYLLTLAPLPSP